MLVLSRRLNESIMIGDNIEVSVLDIRSDHIKLGIKAPKEIKVHRKEIYLAIQKENIMASKTTPDKISKIEEFLKKEGKKY